MQQTIKQSDKEPAKPASLSTLLTPEEKHQYLMWLRWKISKVLEEEVNAMEKEG